MSPFGENPPWGTGKADTRTFDVKRKQRAMTSDENSEMTEAGPRFYVLVENEAAAVAHVTDRGYPPAAIERDGDRFVVLIFQSKPVDQLFGLFQALPTHLSAKIGIMSGVPPFTPEIET